MSDDAAPPGPTTGYYLWRLATRWRATVDRTLADVGLTHAQYALLASLYGLSQAGRQPSQRQLADLSGLDPMFVSKLARSLERAGLLERAEDPADPRAFRLTMTPRGIEIVRTAVATVRDLNDRLTRPIGGSAGARNRELIATLRTLLRETPDPAGSETVTVSPPLSGIDIGTAATATRALLDRLLAEERLTFEEWVAGFTLLQLGPSVRRDELLTDLVGKLNRDMPAIDRLLETTMANGLTQESTPDGSAATVVDLTADGFARIQRIRAGTLHIAEELYGPLDQDDLRTAGRVLREVAARAREMAARS